MQLMTTITTKGQVTIPEAVRQALGASVGDKVAFVLTNQDAREAMFRIIPRNIVDELAGSLKSSIGYIPQEKARAIAARALGRRYKR